MRRKWMLKVIACLLTLCCLITSVSALTEADGVESVQQASKYNTKQIIVKYKDGFSYDSIKTKYEKKIKKSKKQSKLKNNKSDILTVQSVQETEQAIETLNEFPEIDYAVPDDIMQVYETNTDFNAVEAVASGFESAYDLTDGSGVTIAVLDTGIRTDLPIFNGRIAEGGWDFINNDDTVYDYHHLDAHGTQVAGIIAQNAPGVKILPLKFMSGSTGYTSDAIKAIEYAKEKGIKIINCSWGSSNDNLALREAMSDSKLLFICAGGNMIDYGSTGIAYPAAFGLPNIISVGALNTNGEVSSFNNSGITHDLYAPGEDVQTITGLGTGTSYAAAYVTATAALMSSVAPETGMEILALLLKDAYTENKQIRIMDIHKAVVSALPYSMLDDSYGRISLLTGLCKELLSGNILELFNKFDSVNALKAESKTELDNYFDITLTNVPKQDLIGSLLLHVLAKNADITTSQVLGLYFNLSEDFHKLNSELIIYTTIKEKLELTIRETEDVLSLILNNVPAITVMKAMAFTKATGSSLNNAVRTEEIYPEDFSVAEIMQTYCVTETTVKAQLDINEMNTIDLSMLLFNWCQEHGISLNDDTQNAYAIPAYAKRDFNKYTNKNESWFYDKFNINKYNGRVTYYQPLVNILARGGMNLDLVLRFDSEVADAVVNANDLGNINHNYYIAEKREYYYLNPGWTRMPGSDKTYNYTQTDSTFNLDYWNNENGKEYYETGNIKYVKTISIAAYSSASTASSNTSNCYDSVYGMGVGISLNLPLLEIRSQNKYLHFENGAKYSIKQNGSTYTLDGYCMSDVTFSAATDFTADSKTSAYRLSYINGISHYFDVNGKYLGCKDPYGNRKEVCYNSSDMITRIYDPARRYIQFTYSTGIDYKTVTLSMYDNNGTFQRELYNIQSVKDTQTGAYLLNTVRDGANRTSSYNFTLYDSIVSFNGRSSYTYATNVTNKSVALSSVTDMNGLTTTVSYSTATGFYGPSGNVNYKRAGSISQQNSNIVNFGYYYGTGYLPTNGYDLTLSWNLTGEKSILYDNDYSRYISVFGISLMQTPTMTEFYKYDYYGAHEETALMQTWDPVFGQTYRYVSIDKVSAYNERGSATGFSSWVYNSGGSNSYKFSDTARLVDAYGNVTSEYTLTGSSAPSPVNKTQYTYNTASSIPLTAVEYIEKLDNGLIKKQITTNTVSTTYKRIDKTLVRAFIDINNNDIVDALETVLPLYEITYTYNSTTGNLSHGVTKDLQTGVSTTQNYNYDTKYNTYIESVTTADAVKDADGVNCTYNADITKYNCFGEVQESYDVNGHKTAYTYDNIGNITKVEHFEKVAGVQTPRTTDRTEYDYINRTVISKPMGGIWTKTVYDAFGDVTSLYEYNSQTSSYKIKRQESYNEKRQNYQSFYYKEDGSYVIEIRTYDPLNRICRIQNKYFKKPIDIFNPEFLSEEEIQYDNFAAYNGTGNYKKETYISKDSAGQIIAKSATYSSAFGTVYSESWTGSFTGTPQHTDTNTYKDYGVLKASTGDTTVSTSYSYDTAGRQNEYTLASLSTYKSEYSGLGELRTETDALGNTTEYTYDILGRQIKRKAPAVQLDKTYYAESKIWYDSAGNVIKTKLKDNSATSPETWSTTETTYNWQNLPVTVRQVGVSGITPDVYTQYVYDAQGRKVREYSGLHAPLTINHDYTADGSVNNISVTGTDISYSVTCYEYDVRGNLTAYVDALEKRDTFEYGEEGNLLKKTLRNGKVIEYTYDADGNLITASGGNETVTYTYKEGTGLLSEMQDGNGTWTFSYDGEGKLTGETMPGGFAAVHTYGKYGRTGYRLTKNGTEIINKVYDYTEQAQLQTMKSSDNTQKIGYAYDADGNLLSRKAEHSNGKFVIQKFEYNPDGRMAAQETDSSVATVSSRAQSKETYTYDLSGRLISKKLGNSQYGNTQMTNYGYNSVGRMNVETSYSNMLALKNDAITYDDSGNRTSVVTTGMMGNSSQSYTYDAANRMIANGSTPYYYDDSGNLITDGTFYYKAYDYDGFNQMISAGTSTYAYDGLGRRYSKTVNGTTTRHIWDGMSPGDSNITYDEVTNSSGTITYRRDYWHGALNEGMRENGGALQFNISNSHGDIVAVYNISDCSSIRTVSYNAYGVPSSNGTNPYGYSGEYYDSENGFQYLRARYYRPSAASFTQEDTWLDQGPNLYSYCGGDPVNRRDPSGHCPQYGVADVHETHTTMYAGDWNDSEDDYFTYKVLFKCIYGFVPMTQMESTTKYCTKEKEHKAAYEKELNSLKDNTIIQGDTNSWWNDFFSGFSRDYSRQSILYVGSAMTYDPRAWNDHDNILNTTNCYAYALNIKTGYYKLQPGEIAGTFFNERKEKTKAERIIEACKADATKRGKIFKPITSLQANIKRGTYRVALVLGSQDYHWYRQNADGTWSHKPGLGKVTNRDASGKLIWNPQKADRNYSYENYYTFVGYFMVN